MIFVGSDGTRGHVYAFDRRTGNRLWKYDAGRGGSYFDLLVVKGRVIAVTVTEGVVALDARTGARVWSFRLRPAPYTSPATDGKQVFAADADGTLYALDAAHGDLRWSRRLDAQPSNTIALTGSALVVGTSKTSWDDPWTHGPPGAHSLHRVDAATGKVLARSPLSAKALGPPIAIGKTVVVYSGNDLIGVDSRMRVMWSVPARHQSHVPRAQVWNGAVIAPSDPKSIVVVDPSTGSVQRRESVGAGVTTLRTSGDALYAGVAGGKLHAYQLVRRPAGSP